ncbi:thiol-disulfide oxidoreductase ResA [Kurthia huakuii]|uniref:thiol-disulfide oxidoreductase ResA n=1 Tax=Kurthia huakuii TaxID=1421019 RepID=UPI000495B973|nr:thiol-disulfide oxidoreductase ResA [Kurthia huakuii]MBM7698998.1 peroxiredoxin [Kurthia huakuii]
MKKKRVWIRGAIIVVLAVAIVYTIYSAVTKEQHALLQVGDMAPNFTLQDLDGKQQTLADYKGQGVVLNFWGTWCESCKKEMPAFDKYYQQFKDRGVQMLAINVAESDYAVKTFVQQYDMTFPVAIDHTKSVVRTYNIEPLPTTMLINEHGEIVKIITGEMTEQDIKQYMTMIQPK